MKLPAFLFLTAVLVSHPLAAEKPSKAGWVVFGGEHVALVGGTGSMDERYAAGCTIHPKKGKPPVKWGTEEQNRELLIDAAETKELVNVIVDLERRAVVATLALTEPYFLGRSNSDLHVAFGPDVEGRRFALAVISGKWASYDVLALEVSNAGVKQTNIHKTLNAAVMKVVRAKTHGSGKEYGVDYWLQSLPEVGLLSGFAGGEVIRVPFVAQVPKSDTAPVVEGTVMLTFRSGKSGPEMEIGEVRPGKAEIDPTQDDPRIAAADKELNVAYSALRTKLAGAAKTKLVEEQKAWLASRHEKVSAAGAAAEDLLISPRIGADRLLLELTKERVAALRSR